MKNKILISGPNGFIGLKLKKFLEENYEVHTITRNIKGDKDYSINSPEKFPQILEEIKPIAVIHLAAIAHITDSSKNEEEYKKVNYQLTIDLAQASWKVGAKFIFLSSIKVFGDITIGVINNETPYNPCDDYSESKLEAEKEILRIAKKNHSRFTILRPCLVYGENPKGNLKTLLRYSQSKLPNFFPANCPSRQMTSIKNLLKVIEISIERLDGDTLNIADNEGYSPYEIINLYRKKYSLLNIQLPVPIFLWHFLLKLLRKEKIFYKIFSPLAVDVSSLDEENIESKPNLEKYI